MAEGALTAQEVGAACVQWRPMLLKMAMRYARGDRERAEDLVTETTIAAMRNHANYDPALGKISTWLGWRLRGVVSAQYRYRPAERDAVHVSLTRVDDDGEERQADIPVAPTQDDAADLADAMREIRRLPERDQYILLARAEGRNFQELADELGESKERIRQIDERARKLLVRRLNARPLAPPKAEPPLPRPARYSPPERPKEVQQPTEPKVTTEEVKSTARTAAGLRDVLFDQIDRLRSGSIKPEEAKATAALAKQIVGLTRLELDVHLALRDDKMKGARPLGDFTSHDPLMISGGEAPAG